MSVTQAPTPIRSAAPAGDAQFRLLLDAQVELLCHFQVDGLILCANAAYARAFGRTAESLVGASLFDLIPAAERDGVRRALASMHREAPDVMTEHVTLTPAGERWVAWRNHPLTFDADGRALTALASGTDVTDHRRAEAALRDSEQRLRLALESGRMGTWEWHVPTGKVTWSPGLEQIHGYEPGSFAGTVEAYAAEVHPDDKDYVQGVISRTFSGHDHHIEYRIVRRDGQVRWVEGSGKMFADDAGNPVRLVGVCADVTERKEAEARLRDADRRKDEFLATLAHELRNPLAPLRNGVTCSTCRASRAARSTCRWAEWTWWRRCRPRSRPANRRSTPASTASPCPCRSTGRWCTAMPRASRRSSPTC